MLRVLLAMQNPSFSCCLVGLFSTFFPLSGCWLFPDILQCPQPSGGLKASLALMLFLGQKLKFPWFFGVREENGEGGTVSFYANEKTSKSGRWALQTNPVDVAAHKRILFIVLKREHFFLPELESLHAWITTFMYLLCNFFMWQLQTKMLTALFWSFSSQLLKRKYWQLSQVSAICWRQP